MAVQPGSKSVQSPDEHRDWCSVEVDCDSVDDAPYTMQYEQVAAVVEVVPEFEIETTVCWSATVAETVAETSNQTSEDVVSLVALLVEYATSLVD